METTNQNQLCFAFLFVFIHPVSFRFIETSWEEFTGMPFPLQMLFLMLPPLKCLFVIVFTFHPMCIVWCITKPSHFPASSSRREHTATVTRCYGTYCQTRPAACQQANKQHKQTRLTTPSILMHLIAWQRFKGVILAEGWTIKHNLDDISAVREAPAKRCISEMK